MSNPLRVWLMAFRPKTLPAAIALVVTGTTMAYGDGVEHFPSAFIALNADCDGQAGLQELAGNATMLFYMSAEGQYPDSFVFVC